MYRTKTPLFDTRKFKDQNTKLKVPSHISCKDSSNFYDCKRFNWLSKNFRSFGTFSPIARVYTDGLFVVVVVFGEEFVLNETGTE